MIYQISHNIVSSLGFSSEDNYNAVKSGKTNLRLQENTFNLPEPFVGALVNDELLNAEFEKINNTKINIPNLKKWRL